MKQRILFVEDNPLLAEMYAMMLEGEQEHYVVATARDGEQAMELMAQKPFDVVVSDMGLPGMSGIELIDQLKRRYPGCCRIIISGLSDQQEVVRCLNTAHQFLAKPFNVKELKATLARIGALDAFLADEALKSLVSQLGTLPSFPSLYVEVMKELRVEEPSIERITDIVSRDPSMTAKLLQIANSAALGLGRELSSPSEAVQYVGLGTVRSLALSVHIFSCFEQTRLEGFYIDSLWGHVVRTAAIARRLMQLEGAEEAEAEEAYISGMLHDVGKLMLANSLPKEFQRVVVLAAGRPCTLHEAELEVLGVTHAGVAAYLLGLWGLPATIVEAVAFHHTPTCGHAGGFGALTAVHVGNVLEHEFFDSSPGTRKPDIDTAYLSRLGLQGRLDVWRTDAAALKLMTN